MSADGLDPLIHAPARLRLMVTLAALPSGDTLSFTRLQSMLGLTPGNLITHPRKLEGADYTQTQKTGNGRASVTSVALTHEGRTALDTYAATSATCSETDQSAPAVGEMALACGSVIPPDSAQAR